jgi:hypothetical protein
MGTGSTTVQDIVGASPRQDLGGIQIQELIRAGVVAFKLRISNRVWVLSLSLSRVQDSGESLSID